MWRLPSRIPRQRRNLSLLGSMPHQQWRLQSHCHVYGLFGNRAVLLPARISRCRSRAHGLYARHWKRWWTTARAHHRRRRGRRHFSLRFGTVPERRFLYSLGHVFFMSLLGGLHRYTGNGTRPKFYFPNNHPFFLSGMMCQTEVNECASGPCLNGGTCIDRLNGYECQCGNDYQGTNCQDEAQRKLYAPVRH